MHMNEGQDATQLVISEFRKRTIEVQEDLIVARVQLEMANQKIAQLESMVASLSQQVNPEV